MKLNAKFAIDDTELLKRFKKLDMPTQQRARMQAVVAAGQVIATDAKIRAPVLTGNLRRSIFVRVVRSNFREAIAVVGTNVEYARAVEYGINRRRPKPYMRPAYIAKKMEAIAQIRMALKIIILRGKA